MAHDAIRCEIMLLRGALPKSAWADAGVGQSAGDGKAAKRVTAGLRPARKPRRRKLSPDDYQALGAFRRAVRRFLAFSEAGAEAQGMTPQQHQALLAIKAHVGGEAMSVSELAAALLVKTHSAVGLVARLVDRGLVVRTPSARDRRRILLTLSPAGERKLEVISRQNLGQLKSTMPAFRDLIRALEQLDLPAAAEDAADGPRG
jgi:DNA-binding MarR family transcriptional regulator